MTSEQGKGDLIQLFSHVEEERMEELKLNSYIGTMHGHCDLQPSC